MKKLIYLLLGVFLITGCSTDEIDTGKYFPGEELQAAGTSPETAIWVEPQANLERNNGNGKGNGGKKQRVVQLAPSFEPQLATQAITNIMYDPVELPETYLIPADEYETNTAVIDWNGDGIDDVFEVHTRCYWPRSFAWVTVNGVTINNSIATGANLLGFDDVDGDGDLDALFAGGNNRRYNAYDGVNNGPTEGEITEPYSPYNVGYNDVGNTPEPLADLIDNLVIVQDVNNPDFVRWTFGQFLFENSFGDVVSQYDAFPFHVMWREVDPETLEFIPGTLYYQTNTYGEWGIGSSHLPVSGTVWFRFTNADDTVSAEDECVDKEIYVTY